MSKNIVIGVNAKQFNGIIAGLRLLQTIDSKNPLFARIKDLATDHGGEMMTKPEIDELVETLNCGDFL